MKLFLFVEELSFEEFATSQLVANYLTELGIEIQSCANTGIVGLIHGKNLGKTIALRADMDALPIFEENEVDYKSQNAGKMHACGHDVHTSSLLGTAKLLKQNANSFDGTIKLIFQPAEEKLPGGANLMIQEGVLRNPDVSEIYGQHVTPFIECGKIGIRSGMYMASTDEIYITVHGKGAHGAMPHLSIDPISITCAIISTLQQIVSRKADPRIPSVLTFGRIVGLGATNIIPDKVELQGTFRTYNEEWRDTAHVHLKSIATAMAESMGAKIDIQIIKGYPVLFNDPEITGKARTQISDFMGEENVIDLDLWTAAEDFAYYTHEIPGCFYRLGTRNENKGCTYGLHTSRFNIDENALGHSTGLMAWLAVNALK